MRHRSSFKDWTGERVGRLLVIKEMPRPKGQCQTLWHVRCDCGNEKFTVHSASLKSGKSTSCGCLRKELFCYSGPPDLLRSRKNPLYSTWRGLIYRCTNPDSLSWMDYGGRGIRVCQSWLESFALFVNDMGKRPSGLSIDRIDVNGDYEPLNCRWATRIQQAQNQRNMKTFLWKGENLCLKEICRREGVCFYLAGKSIKSGGDVEAAIEASRHKPFVETAATLGALPKAPRVKDQVGEAVMDPAYQRIAKAILWCRERGIRYHGQKLPPEFSILT